MSYFSRLTEIVTCNITQLLAQSENPQLAIAQIILEIEEGVAGARRSVSTAAGNEERISREIHDQHDQATRWASKAREQLAAGSEAEARQAIIRKREIEDLIAGLQQQQHAAAATREHLQTIQRAMEARLSEALRKQAALAAGESLEALLADAPNGHNVEQHRSSEVDEELAALRRELGV